MKVCVIGLGYIGFPTACVISRAGHEVVGVDVNPDILSKLRSGSLHIVNEEGLEDLARSAFAHGRLRVSTVPEPADVFIIAVPTPCQAKGECRATVSGREVAATSQSTAEEPTVGAHWTNNGDTPDFVADLTFVEEATRGIVPYVRKDNLVVLESTVPPVTTDGMMRDIIEQGTGLVCGQDVFLAHAPERVLPGRILAELTENDRVVGGVDERSTKNAVSFYQTFIRGSVIGTDATTAEFVKLTENTFRDVNIALANELALICEQTGINVNEVISLANRHPRVNLLSPGPGVGGHCIAVDPYFIVQTAPEMARLIATARQVNSHMPHHVVAMVTELDKTRSDRKIHRIVALGASYKPDVGDERESPALEVVNLLSELGYEVLVHDPYIQRFAERPLSRLIDGADLLIMLTNHRIYKGVMAPAQVYAAMRQPLLIDSRGFFGFDWDRAGFHVARLGVGAEARHSTHSH